MLTTRARAAIAAAWTMSLVLSPAGGALAEERDSVSVAAPWHVSSLDTAKDGYSFQRMQVGETLVDAAVDDADAQDALLPGLATDWSVSEDGLSWRFTLRDGVVFHDGTPMTAEAVKSSLEHAVAKPGILQRAEIATIEATDGAVVLTLARPFSALPAALANYSAMILAPASYDAAGEVVAFLGTGPFKVASFEPPLTLVVSRFDAYWGEKPAIAEARYLSAPRAETRAMMAEGGDADISVGLDAAGYKRLASLEGMTVEVRAIPRVIAVKLNLARPSLADADARRALSLAIDRQGIAAGIMAFPEAAATQLFPPAMTGWHDSAMPPLSHDVVKAKSLLADLGWTPGEDGVLTRGGERFSLTLSTYPNRPELPLVAAALQDQWRQIGVELKVSVGNSSDIPAGHRDGSLDVGLEARNYGQTPDPLVTAYDDFGVGGGDWGAMNWDAPAVVEALDTAMASSDPKARAAAVKMVADTLQQELPMIPIAWYQHVVAYPTALKDVVVDPLERNYGLSKMRWSE